MYLEVSARMTGKTTRMIDNILLNIIDGKHCIIFTYNVSESKRIKELINERFKKMLKYSSFDFRSLRSFIEPTFFTSKKKYEDYCEDVDVTKHRLYFDEFDFINPKEIIVNQDGYYATTSKFERIVQHKINHFIGVKYDVMVDLMDRNRNKVITYSTDVSKMTLKELKEYKK